MTAKDPNSGAANSTIGESVRVSRKFTRDATRSLPESGIGCSVTTCESAVLATLESLAGELRMDCESSAGPAVAARIGDESVGSATALNACPR